MRDYNIDCEYAINRLVKKGIPATVEHDFDTDPTPSSTTNIGFYLEFPQSSIFIFTLVFPGVLVAQVTQNFITSMDALKLDLRAVDEIQPQLNDLLETLNKIPELPSDFEGKVKLKDWLALLNRMRASDELDASQIRQLLFDLESSYNAFHRFLAR